VPDADRNLLFAVLALQADCLTQARFVEACTLWASQKDVPMPELLARHGWLQPDEIADVERLLARKLKKHNGDARAGIAEATADAVVRQSLDSVPDDGIRATVTPPARGHVLLTTIAREPDAGERYTVTRLHATGGIGRVWLARDGSLGRDVALKDLRPERAANPTVWGRFLREAQITGQLEHPGIVPVYELGRRDDGQPFYTMRFVRGRTLREAVAAYQQKRERRELGPLDLRELLTAFVGVCNAIAYAHSKGVVHRDLKPANVVLGEFGEVMVLDWGLAKNVADEQPTDAPSAASQERTSTESASQTLEGQVLGTPAYMAPEQAEGRLADIDARTDVYGLGAILYEVLTGKPPFTGATTEEVLSRVRGLLPDLPCAVVADTPRALEAVCLKALAKKSADRYQTATALADDVQHFMADEPTTALREPLTARAWRWARRHRTLVTAAVAVLAVAVPILATGIVLVNQSERRERAAREQEEAARKDEQAAREKAQANYQRSLRAADALAEELARGIRPIAGTQTKTVLAVLDRAKQITDDLLTDPDASQEVLERKARMLVQFSELYRDVNRSEAARKSVEQALATLDRLIEQRPDDRALKLERGQARNRVGWALYDQGRFREALAAFRASAAELDANGATADPRLAARFLASSFTFEGNILAHYGDNAAAERAYKQGLELRRAALAAAPTDPVVRAQLAVSLQRFGAHLVRTGAESDRKSEGLKMLREGRTVMTALCAENSTDSVLHLQLSTVLTTLASWTSVPTEGLAALDAGEKLVAEFTRRDPDHVQWRREAARYKSFRNDLRIRAIKPGIGYVELNRLRTEEFQTLTDLYATFTRGGTEDPDNFFWQIDRVSTAARLGKSHAEVGRLWVTNVYGGITRAAGRVPDIAQAVAGLKNVSSHFAEARKLTREAVEQSAALLARVPGATEYDSSLVGGRSSLWEVEHIVGDAASERAARWEYDALVIANAHRDFAAHPNDEHANFVLRRTYFHLAQTWKPATEPPDWDVLSRPEVLRAMAKLAGVLADLPATVSPAQAEYLAPIRQRVIDTVRAVEAKGLLPPEGKKLLEKYPPEKK
jgi:tRNA A-37 threonylcarbamoyl transferase component Bud32/tetratricopeptide (TPR) repeat protein